MKGIKIGIFGFNRGGHLADNILALNGDIVAVCEKNEAYLELAKQKLGSTATYYTDFDSFIEHSGMEAVLLANYFHEHAPYAIRCLEKGIHVLSECIPNGTMAEGVALVEAAEKSSAKYMLLENYPFMLFNQEMKKVKEGGTLGKIVYAEGEYNHAVNYYSTDLKSLYDSPKHWRLYVPRTYYVTHSLAPIAYATGALPVRVTAMPVYCPAPEDCNRASNVGDIAAVITTLNDDQSVFKFTGCAAFGGSENSYRLCGQNGMIENLRGTDGKIMLRYNHHQIPEGKQEVNYYMPQWDDKDAELIKKAGHGGGDFCVIREFFNCIAEDRQPDFDVYFATRLASVAILGCRSMLQLGTPYDIPDFKKKEDREKWKDDTLSPFYYTDGKEPTLPCCSNSDYLPSQQQIENFNALMK